MVYIFLCECTFIRLVSFLKKSFHMTYIVFWTFRIVVLGICLVNQCFLRMILRHSLQISQIASQIQCSTSKIYCLVSCFVIGGVRHTGNHVRWEFCSGGTDAEQTTRKHAEGKALGLNESTADENDGLQPCKGPGNQVEKYWAHTCFMTLL